MAETTSKKRKNLSNVSTVEDVWSMPNWPPQLEKAFVELLIEEMKIYVDACAIGFNEKAWDHVTMELNQETGLNYDKLDLLKHLTVLRKRFCIVKPLYDHGGFGCDYRQKMVDVDDGVWQEYIEVDPEIKPYRKWGCPIYDELCTIFTKPIATGEYAITPTELARSIQANSNHRYRPNTSNYRSIGRSSSGLKKGHFGGTVQGNGSQRTKMPNSDQDPYSASKCITVINGMQGVDRRLFCAVVELFQNSHWRKTFMLLKTEKRLAWLKVMLP